MPSQSASPEELKEILAKDARSEPLSLWEQDELAIWRANQVDQEKALKEVKEQLQLQQAVMGVITKAGTVVTKVSQITKDFGDMLAGRFIAPASTATSTEPTNAGFTGAAMSGDGEVFGSDTYHIVGVKDGVLQFGLSATTGKAYAGAGAVILDVDGLTVKADNSKPYITFKDENGNTVATIFQDGAGNLQIDLDEHALTVNDGNVIVNRATDTDSNFSLFENNVRKAYLWFDTSEENVSLENEVSGGRIFLVLKGGTSNEIVSIYDRTASLGRFRFRNNGGFEILECSTDPDYIDGYAVLYHLDTGVVKLRVKQGATENEYTLSGTWLASDADYSDISANDAATDVTGAELEELTDGSTTTLHSHAGSGGIYPMSEMKGLTLSNNGSDATNDIDIAAGWCCDSTHTQNLTLASALTKRLDATWAVGTNQGMRDDAAAITDTTYHIYLVMRSDTGVVDIYATTQATAAGALTNLQGETGGSAYDYARRIGSILRESGAIVGFIQDGDRFVRNVVVRSSSVSNQGTAAVAITLNTPVGIRMRAIIVGSMFDATATAQVNWLITDPSQTDSAPTTSLLTMYSNYPASGQRGWSFLGLEIYTNTSAQIRSRVDTQLSDLYLNIFTHGWIDRRGRDG